MKNPPMKADHDGIGTNQIFTFFKYTKYQIMREEKNLNIYLAIKTFTYSK
jgi:hypothetical protein